MHAHGQPDRKQLRSFGLIVGGIFFIIALWPLVFRGESLRVWAVVPTVVLVPPALVYPPVLYWPFLGWMFIGHILGAVNTRIILTLMFFLLFTPVGLIMRLFRYDPMARRLNPSLTTYKTKVKPKDSIQMERQF